MTHFTRPGAWLTAIALAPGAVAQPAGIMPLTLDAAVSMAVARSPRLASQHHAVDAAEAVIARTGEWPDPKLRFGLDNLPVTGEDRFRYDRDFMTMRRIGVMQEIPHPDKRSAAREVAVREAAVERIRRAREVVLVRREAAVAWMDHAYAMVIVARLVDLRGRIGMELEALAPQLSAGRASAVDLTALQAVRESLVDRHLAQLRLVERTRIELERWVGPMTVRSLAPIPETAVAPPEVSPAPATLERHPAVMAATVQVGLAGAQVEATRATRQPDWAIEFGYGQRAPAFPNMVTLMVQVDLPLWPGQRQDRDVAARVARHEEARAQRDEAERVARTEIGLALADHTAAHQRVKQLSTRSLPVARERAEAALALYASGKGTLAAVLEARRMHAELELDVLAVERERALAWVALRHTLLARDDIAAIRMEDRP